jgi:hypothetical protein
VGNEENEYPVPDLKRMLTLVSSMKNLSKRKSWTTSL